MLTQYFSDKSFNILLLGTLLLLLAVPSNKSYAQTVAQEMKTTMADCRRIENKEVRLNCYDKTLDVFSNENASPTIEDNSQETKEFGLSTPTPKPSNGLFSKVRNNIRNRMNTNKKHDSETPKNVIIKIIKTTEFGYKKTKFYLENGQIWKQVDSRSIRINKKSLNNAHISKAALGSYLLRINGKGTAIRVIRVK